MRHRAITDLNAVRAAWLVGECGYSQEDVAKELSLSQSTVSRLIARAADVHYGRASAILELRHRTRLTAYAAHPERFVQGPPRPETLPEAVWINAPIKTARQDAPVMRSTA